MDDFFYIKSNKTAFFQLINLRRKNSFRSKIFPKQIFQVISKINKKSRKGFYTKRLIYSYDDLSFFLKHDFLFIEMKN